MIRSCTGRTPGAAERKIFKTDGFTPLGPFLSGLRGLLLPGTGRVFGREDSLSHPSSSQRIWELLPVLKVRAAADSARSAEESSEEADAPF
jgi:hypothetical protein